jgi:predicted nucleic acid-binding protein
MNDRQRNRRIYFDANAFIYLIEGEGEISSLLHSLLAALRRQAKLACTSEFTLAEVLPKANMIQRRSYFTLILHSGLFDLLPVTREILIETADYRTNRSRHSFDVGSSMPKLPDAIHVVSAIHAGCDTFVSFDRALKLPIGLDRVGCEDGRLLQLLQDIS